MKLKLNITLREGLPEGNDNMKKRNLLRFLVTGGTLGSVSHPSGKGKRLIILHAGGSQTVIWYTSHF